MKHTTSAKKEDSMDLEKFRIQMQREMILQKLKEGGYRITKQRIAVIDIILENDCGSCKEIFYKTAKINKKIGAATIYRTINMLEEIGAINRRNLYKLSDLTGGSGEEMVLVLLEDGEELQLTSEEWNEVLQMGLQACGYLEDEKIVSVVNG
ncbi:transcriptional repressor [Anaerotignum sp.]